MVTHTTTLGTQNLGTNDLVKAQHEQTRKTIISSIAGRKITRPWGNANATGEVPEDDGEIDATEKFRLIQDMILRPSLPYGDR